MAGKFNITMIVGIYNPEFSDVNTFSNYRVEPDTFGMRKGELEVSEIGEDPGAGLIRLAQVLKGIKRPAPITFLWSPPKGQERLVASHFKNKKLLFDITFEFLGSRGQLLNKHLLTINDVHILKSYPDRIKGGSSGLKHERVDATFRAEPVFTTD